MTQLVVSFAQMQSAIDHMREFDRDVAECLEDVDRTMAALRMTWHGEASDSQARAQQQWEDGAEQMKQALSQLKNIAETARRNAETARRNYADTVEKNGRMWE